MKKNYTKQTWDLNWKETLRQLMLLLECTSYAGMAGLDAGRTADFHLAYVFSHAPIVAFWTGVMVNLRKDIDHPIRGKFGTPRTVGAAIHNRCRTGRRWVGVGWRWLALARVGAWSSA
jgi:hypothetical protein